MISLPGGPLAIVTWQSSDSDGTGIVATSFTGVGDTSSSGEVLVNTKETGDQTAPTIASADGPGQFIIAWQGPGEVEEADALAAAAAVPGAAGEEEDEGEEEASLQIFAQRFQANPAMDDPPFATTDSEFVVNSILSHDHVTPAVAMSNAGDFAVAFVAEGQQGSGSDVYIRRFDDQGEPLGDDYLVNTQVLRPQRAPAIGMTDGGNFLVTWQSSHQEPDPFSWGIFGRKFNADGTVAEDVEFLVNELTSGPQTNAAVGVDGTGTAVAAWIGLDASHHPAIHGRLYGIGDDQPATAVSGELVLANYSAPEESPPAAGMDGFGNSLVVWQSYLEDGSGLGVFGQRLSDSGSAIGGRFLVNTNTFGNQSDPDIAMNASGQSIVVWQSQDQDGDGYGIFAQRYGADGLPVGDEFQVNSNATGNQTAPAVGVAADGAFVVVWQSMDTDGYGIFARRYDSLGNPLDAGEWLVNQETALDQFGPAVAMNAGGQFVVTWVSDHPAAEPDTLDTEKSVFAQWYDSDGGHDGPEFLVHNFVKDAQEHPDVAIGSDGSFVVVWQSINQDGNTWGVFARQFTPDKQSPQRREFVVNETRQGPQRYASVAVDGFGRFVVNWQSNSRLQEGSSWEIYSQQYTADGVREGGEYAVNTWTQGPQIHPVVAQAPDGRFGLFWIGAGTDHVEGVHGRLYGSVATMDGDLYVMGTPDSEEIDVVRNGDQIEVLIGLSVIGRYNANDVYQRIVIDAGEGRNMIRLGADLGISAEVRGRDGDDIIFGTDGDDVLAGGQGFNIIFGRGGDDQITGGNGTDILFGGAGDDMLVGGQAFDLLFGCSGNDRLFGGEGFDGLFGGFGDDYLNGGEGIDLLFGGFGNDELHDGGWGWLLPIWLILTGGTNLLNVASSAEVDDDVSVTVSGTVPNDIGVTSNFQVSVSPSETTWRNSNNPLDVDGSGKVIPLDVITLVNHLNLRGSGPLPTRTDEMQSQPFYDVTGDNQATAQDVLVVVNYLNTTSVVPSEVAESEGPVGEMELPPIGTQRISETTAPILSREVKGSLDSRQFVWFSPRISENPIGSQSPEIVEQPVVDDASTIKRLRRAESTDSVLHGFKDVAAITELEELLDCLAKEVDAVWATWQ